MATENYDKETNIISYPQGFAHKFSSEGLRFLRENMFDHKTQKKTQILYDSLFMKDTLNYYLILGQAARSGRSLV